jgi:hypothetical protein
MKMVHKSSQQRKKASIKILKDNNIKVFEGLPLIEKYEKIKIRDKEEIIKRAIAICIVSVYAEGICTGTEVKKNQELISGIIKKYNASTFFTKEERKFMDDADPLKKDAINFAWKYECYNVLLWALSFFDDLEMPNKICDVPKIVQILVDNKSYEEFERNSKVREKEEILDQADLIYRYNWACVDARINGKKINNLDSGVVVERHYALNWLINYLGQDWDNVTTDT